MRVERIGEATLYTADVLEALRSMADESVHCVMTSPPYWGLRNYGVDGQLGLERLHDCLGWATGTPCGECYVCHIVAVFRELRRVLRPDGTCWLNFGDSYAGGGRAGNNPEYMGKHKMFGKTGWDPGIFGLPQAVPCGLKPKDLCMMPARVALALQVDGWYLRSDCPWIKRNPMPESCTDRPTKALEYVFLITKSARYWYDAETVKIRASPATNARISQNLASQVGSFRANGGNKTNGPMRAVMAGTTRKIAEAGSGIAANRSMEAALSLSVSTRNRRNSDWFTESWQGLFLDENGDPLAFVVNPKGFKGAHFATFPEKLVEPCVLAGCPAQVCPECGAPWVRVVERKYRSELIKGEHTYQPDTFKGNKSRPRARANNGTFLPRGDDARPNNSKNYGIRGAVKRFGDGVDCHTLGFRPTCAHDQPPVPGTFLDPFCGAGTALLVALRLGRRAMGIELKPEYMALTRKRIGEEAAQGKLL